MEQKASGFTSSTRGMNFQRARPAILEATRHMLPPVINICYNNSRAFVDDKVFIFSKKKRKKRKERKKDKSNVSEWPK